MLGNVPLVGRALEVSVIADRLDVIEERGGCLLIAGEPGVGKTRLLAEAVTLAHGRGFAVIQARAHEAFNAGPYALIAEALRSADAIIRPGSEWSGVLDRIGLGSRSRLDEAGLPLPGDHERTAFFADLATLILSIGGERPVLLALDDLHWADSATLRFLEFLAPQLTRASFLLVGAYRSSEARRRTPLAQLLGSLPVDGPSARITLAGLTESDVDALATSFIDGHVPASLIRRLASDTGGNALFLTEILRDLASRGALSSERDPRDPLPLPPGIREAIFRRLDQLPSDTNEFLAMAAVLGGDFELVLLAAASDTTPTSALDRLGPANRATITAPTGDPPGRFAFTHPLIRRTVYEDLEPSARARLHGAAGRAIERRTAVAPSIRLPALAYHFVNATLVEDAAPAIRYSREAGDAAFRQLGYEEAARHYSIALGLMRQQTEVDGPLQRELTLAEAEARIRAGETDEARRLFVEATELARAAGDADRLSQAALGYAGYRGSPGAPDMEAIRLLELAVALPAEPLLRSRVLARLAMELYYVGERERREALTTEAVALAREAGDKATLARSLVGRHYALHLAENLEARTETSAEAARLAEAAGDHETAMLAYYLGVRDHLEAGDLGAARAAAERHRALSLAVRQTLYTWRTMLLDALFIHLSGDLARAEALATEAYAFGNGAGIPNAPQTYAGLINTIRIDQGRVAEMEPLIREAMRRYPSASTWPAIVGLCQLETGDAASARDTLHLGVAALPALAHDEGFMTTCFALALIGHGLDDPGPAAALTAELEPFRDRVLVVPGPVACLGPVVYLLALLATTARDWAKATRDFEAALRSSRRLESPPWEARARLGFGDLLLRRNEPGDSLRARVLLAEAAAGARRCGMTAIARESERLLAIAQGVVPRLPAGLSEREAEVLGLLASGLTNREIAGRLVVSVRTVDAHVATAYRKVGARRRGDAVAFALTHGLAAKPGQDR